MKKAIKLTAAVLAGTMLAGFGAGCETNSGAKNSAVSYVGIDVNPSLTLMLDKNNKVVSVTATNEDGQVLLYGENLNEIVGKSVEEASKKIASLCVEFGYLNEENKGVNVTVEGEANADAISGKIQAGFTASAEEEGLSLNFSADGLFSVNRALKAVKAEYSANAEIQKLSSGQYKLILEAQTADKSLTLEAAASMSTAELVEIVSAAADKAKPYATAAYQTAVSAANYTYEMAKGQLLDACWLLPYTDYLVDIVSGKKVYYGAIYNLYTSTSRALQAGINAAEAAAAVAEGTAVSNATVSAVVAALGLDETEAAKFKAAVAEKGNTLAALEAELDKYFKNMSAEAYQAAKPVIDEVMAEVQKEADKIATAVSDGYQKALEAFAAGVEIPAEIKNTANTYLNEFSTLMDEIETATSGKEPLAAAYGALDALNERAEKVLKAMKDDLTAEDVEKAENAIKALDEKLSAAKKAFDDAVEKAKKDAEDYLAGLKAERTAKAQ